jgi:hypothetical protein
MPRPTEEFHTEMVVTARPDELDHTGQVIVAE